MITLGLADDEPLFTAGLAMILDAQPDMRILWQAIDGADAIRRHQHAQPDVLLLDIQMPGTDGLAVTRQLIADDSPSRIVILTTFDADEYVLTAIETGAAGFLVKNTPPDRLIEAIHTVHRGDAVISPGPTRRLFASYRTRPSGIDPSRSPAGDSPGYLTIRERDVLTLIAKGLTNSEICDRLWLSMPTIKTHIGNLLAKTHSRDRVQLVLYALRTGIATINE
ncbi:Oxygen regulatory protein NreC [Micromonospora sp. MW-13]|uniref:response regulator n=1 Tax=unclassified Micromonospora TaxID=2617518 RepID=UPI000E44B54C|nr:MULTISPECIES: response regulator transcription factor [unclassified Micromonospora]MCX4473026.1 response regulator transcription factor [Micromonospora sp. NBC_01655]RGC65257.1 Oxygen regulatory protein NreC [Micromonospora sp. MW-13]